MPTRIVIQERGQDKSQSPCNLDDVEEAVGGRGALALDKKSGGGSDSDADPANSNGAIFSQASSPAPRFGLTRQATNSLRIDRTQKPKQQQDQQHSSPIPTVVAAPASKGDIVASPRLIGYFLNLFASLICMVSAAKFYQQTVCISSAEYEMYTNNADLPKPSASVGSNSINSTVDMGMGNRHLSDAGPAPAPSSAGTLSRTYRHFDMAIVIGGPEPLLYNPYGASRILQSRNDDTGQNITVGADDIDANTTEYDIISENTSIVDGDDANTTEYGNTSIAPTLVPTLTASYNPSAATTDRPSTGPSSPPTSGTSQEKAFSLVPSAIFSEPSSSSTGQETNNITTSNNTAVPTPSGQSQQTNTTSESAKPSSEPSIFFADLDNQTTYSTAPNNNTLPETLCARPLRQVDHWKMWGAICVPAVGCIISLLVIIAHFDNKCFPKTWRRTFEAGSKAELRIIIILVLYWAAGLYVLTGVNSVGYVQANVFFSAWACFGSSVMLVKLWREGAGRESLLEKIVLHSRRKTTYNWFWTLIFSSILLFSLLDAYANRNSSKAVPSLQNVEPQTWKRLWIIVSITTVLCMAVPVTNHYLTRPQTDTNESTRKFRIVFRQVEGMILLCLLGIFAYMITNFTGVASAINGINNPYIGTWGTFLSIVLTWSTWLRDKKNVKWVAKAGGESEVILSSLKKSIKEIK